MIEFTLTNLANEEVKMTFAPDENSEMKMMAIIVSENDKSIILSNKSDDVVDAVFNIDKTQIELLYTYIGNFLKQM